MRRKPCAVWKQHCIVRFLVLVKALAQIHCGNLSTLLPISGAEFHLPGTRVLNKDPRVCSSAKMSASKELCPRCETEIL